MRLPRPAQKPTEINILSMIDVIFSILAFFIVATLFLSRSQGLDVSLPKASTAKSQDNPSLEVSIKSDGKIAVNKTIVDLDQLAKSVRKEIDPDADVSLVIVKADEEVKHGSVVEVMDIVRQIEGVKLAIAAKKSD